MLHIHKLRNAKSGTVEQAVIVDLMGESYPDAGKKRQVFQRKIIVFTIRWMRTKY